MLQLCPFKGPSLFLFQKHDWWYLLCYSYVGGMFVCFNNQTGDLDVKSTRRYSTAITLFFSDKNLWFSSPWKKGKSRWRRLAVLVIKLCLLCLACFLLRKFKFNCHCFVTKTCQLLSQVSLSWHLIKCVNCICLNCAA